MNSATRNFNSADDQFEAEIRDHLNNWCTKSDVPSTDQIIDAFKEGVKIGLENNDKYAKQIFMNNIKHAIKLSEAFYTWVKSQKINNASAYLKIENIDNFETLILIDSDSYYNKVVRSNLYNKAKEFRKENNTNTFNIEFILKPHSSELKNTSLQNHGYYLSYNPKA